MFLENLFPHPLRADYAAGRVHSSAGKMQFAPVVVAGGGHCAGGTAVVLAGKLMGELEAFG